MDYMDRIKAERENHDESQRDIAKILGMPQSQYQKYEAHIQGDIDILISNIKEMDWPR